MMPGAPVSSRTRKKRRVGQPAPPTPKQQQPFPTPRAPTAPTPTKTRSRFFDGAGANPGGSTATVKAEDVEQLGEGCGDAGDVAAGARGGGPAGALQKSAGFRDGRISGLAGTPAVEPGSAAQWQRVVGGGSDDGLWCELGLAAAELRLEQ